MASVDDDVTASASELGDTIPDTEGEDELSSRSPILQHRPKELAEAAADTSQADYELDDSEDELAIIVEVPTVRRPWEYVRIPENTTVARVIDEVSRPGNELWYRIEYRDDREETVPFDKLLTLRKGPRALDLYDKGRKLEMASSPETTDGVSENSSGRSLKSSGIGNRSRSTINKKPTYVTDDSDSEDLLNSDMKRRRTDQLGTSFRIGNRTKSTSKNNTSMSSDSEPLEPNSRKTRSRHENRRGVPPARGRLENGRITRSSEARSANRTSYDDENDSQEITEFAQDRDESEDELPYLPPKATSKFPSIRGRGRGRPRSRPYGRIGIGRGRGMLNRQDNDSSSSQDRPEPTRRSARTTTSKNMREQLEDEEVFADDVYESRGPQITSIREVFESLPAKSAFRAVHNKNCDVCGGYQTASNKGVSPLVYCQGCSTSIHKLCLGTRSTREHLVTKVGDDSFVLQCRRCVCSAKKKDANAPRLDICQTCKKSGDACEPFSQKRTPKQEEKLRNENDGIDPITHVDDRLINNASIVLFRCTDCHRGFHFEHLPPQSGDSVEMETVENLHVLRRAEYSEQWQCIECLGAPAKIQGLMAWRPSNIDTYIPGRGYDAVSEDEKEYLIKWEDRSHFGCTWMPGAWVWGVTVAVMRNAFARRDEGANYLPKMKEEDAIPEEFLRMEIVLDVEYSSHVKTHTEEIDKARINEVDSVYVKFQGLGYEDVVWEHPPAPNEPERWADFVAAYNEFVAGKYFKQPQTKMKERVQSFRALDFNKKVLLNEQPASLTGGQMMEYQQEGLNWLLYNYHKGKNVILADEMGLGKTIQVIGLIAALVKEKPKCWPFLVVVPNSTCPNWRREIKKWAPSLRVVAYYGVKKAKDIAMRYELYPDGCSDLRAHVVVTSFDAPVDEYSRSFFKKVKWAGMVVDEGQRLKNDKNLLYGALSALKIPFRILLTGTPLQNNKRELFNLLQFLDSTMDAATLDEKYTDLTDENLAELHELIRPFFLRRTKVQVLKFLPPMAQVILPVTMSIVQKKLYKSILARNPDLIRSILVKDQAQLRPAERGNLNNILIQLRKVLCHPFIYSGAIEEKSAIQAVSHRNLVDAASKLQLLEIMLPKLHDRGHRVLIFSQFLMQLDIVEDFLEGLGLSFQRLDGNVGSLEKQKRIDAFNAPDSPLFAFLLSTRAGGVGINLATADTVIIMDPDFNPHQDIQALSRAHRIGQKKKVLVFQLMTKDSAEEKIVQIGRKKMALDHALIESMDADDDTGVDLQSILKHGAQALFDDNDQNDIKYDSASVDKLLDRSLVEDTNVGDDKSAESQFSYARIWANDSGMLTDNDIEAGSDSLASASTVWDKILQQREADAAREAAEQHKMFGRGKRMRQNVDYKLGDEIPTSSPSKPGALVEVDAGSDTDFATVVESGPDEDYSDGPQSGLHLDSEMRMEGDQLRINDEATPAQTKQVDSFRRVKIANPIPPLPVLESERSKRGLAPNYDRETPKRQCFACGKHHAPGVCPLKLAGVEHCGLCGLAHFGGLELCPHLRSERQVRLMLDALKTSTEPREDIEFARIQLRSRIHDIVAGKKRKRESTGPEEQSSPPQVPALQQQAPAPAPNRFPH